MVGGREDCGGGLWWGDCGGGIVVGDCGGIVVGDCGGGGIVVREGLWWGDCGGYIFFIYISILINYPDCVQCAIINLTTFLSLKADYLIW